MSQQYSNKLGFATISSFIEEATASIESAETEYQTDEKTMGTFFSGEEYEKNKVRTSLAETIKGSGHIPILLSGINAAETFQKAARSVAAYQIEWYFKNVSSFGEKQALEYKAKHNMMTAIADLHHKLFKARYAVANNADSGLLTLYNTVIHHLEEDVIKANQKSLPAFVEFDLYSTFVKKVHGFIEAMPAEVIHTNRGVKVDLSKLRNHLFHAYKTSSNVLPSATPYAKQSEVSNSLYSLLSTYVKELGLPEDIDNAPDDFDGISIEMEEQLKYVLPLIQYLNSSDNPFAKNGLFGQAFKMPLHTKAKELYQRHETNEIHGGEPQTLNAKVSPLSTFNEDQMDQLLYGSEDVDAMMKSFSGTKGKVKGLFGFLTSGDTEEYTMPKTFEEREEQQSNNLLSLTAPDKYQLRLEYNPDASRNLSKKS